MKTNAVLFACTYDNQQEREEGIEFARQYIKENGYTSETAAIRDTQDMILVRAK